MNTLLAVVSAHTRDDWANAIRSTWVPLVPEGTVDVRFFRGRGATRDPLPDEVFLDCDDSYDGLPDKVQAMIRWAYEHGYDFFLKIDDDVVIDPVKLVSSGYALYPYSGRANRPMRPDRMFVVPYGFCYWLSRDCMKIVIDGKLPVGSNDDEKWVASLLHDQGVHLISKEHYRLHYELEDRSNYPLYRPLCKKKMILNDPPEMFAWCIHLSSPGDTRYTSEMKISVFHKVFQNNVLRSDFGTKVKEGILTKEKSMPSQPIVSVSALP